MRSPLTSPYIAGEVIADRYCLVRELGRGGMGVVWVAHSMALDVEVALKLIRVNVAGSAAATRMEREAHAAARLGHPALVHVFDFGWTHRGDPYLVMELVQGETLCARLARVSSIPAIRAVQMILPIADGLRLAHGKSIVHRDIKPDNMFLASDALGRLQPKLLDFGIAKVGHVAPVSRLTRDGVVMGSPEYMSPEQALGLEEVDERTDVWSLAVVLYEMVVGQVPFRGANYNALMQSIISESPVPRPECDRMDTELWRVLERGLAKERGERWASMADFGTALAFWLNEHGVREDVSGNSLGAVWLEGSSSDRAVALRAPAHTADQTADRNSEASAVLPDAHKVADRPDPARRAHSKGSTPIWRRRPALLVGLAVLTCGAGLALWAVSAAPKSGLASAGVNEVRSALPSQSSARPTAGSVRSVPDASAPVQSAPPASAATSYVQDASTVSTPRRTRRANRRAPGHDFGF